MEFIIVFIITPIVAIFAFLLSLFNTYMQFLRKVMDISFSFLGLSHGKADNNHDAVTIEFVVSNNGDLPATLSKIYLLLPQQGGPAFNVCEWMFFRNDKPASSIPLAPGSSLHEFATFFIPLKLLHSFRPPSKEKSYSVPLILDLIILDNRGRRHTRKLEDLSLLVEKMGRIVGGSYPSEKIVKLLPIPAKQSSRPLLP
jgi:hypothetical protein